MEESAVRVPFTLSELWVLQSVVRHEVAQSDQQWKNPPARLDLNHQIAAALVEGETAKALNNEPNPTLYLELSMGDCLAIDFTVPAAVKDPSGNPVGRDILMKSYRARADIARHLPGTLAEEPATPTASAVAEMLAEWDGETGA